MTSPAAPAQFLPWDTDFFGFRIGRVSTSRLTPESVATILQWNDAQRIQCLYFSADTACGQTHALAHQAGFQFVDLRVELCRRLEPMGKPAINTEHIRIGTPGDLAPLQAIARMSHHDTRFFKDRRFPLARAEALYAEWIRRDLELNQVLVVTRDEPMQTPAGYITCQLDSATRLGRIGLIAVAEDQQGKGLGRTLVEAGLNFFRAAQCPVVNVATQASNLRAQRLYQAAGFRSCESSVWFHRWSSTPGIVP